MSAPRPGPARPSKVAEPRSIETASPGRLAVQGRVLAFFEDTGGAADLLEWSAALARTLRLEFGVVYVESTLALAAASLPATRVLEPARQTWLEFAPHDVERGWRAQAERLRLMVGSVAQRYSLGWSLRTVRGAWPQTAFEMFHDAGLMFLGRHSLAAAWPIPPRREPAAQQASGRAPRRTTHRPVVVVVAGETPAGVTCEAVAAELAHAMGAIVHRTTLEQALAPDARAPHADVLVLPRELASHATLAHVRCPVLLVAYEVAPVRDMPRGAK